MPHQNVHSSKATAQNAVTDPVGPGDQTQAGCEPLRPEPRSYAAPEASESSLAPPAAGEVADYMDEGDPIGADDVQQGSTHANRPERTEKLRGQGPKTRAGNRDRVKSGSAGGR